MNLKDTDLENKRKQAIEALVADSMTLAERLLLRNVEAAMTTQKET